MTEQFLLSFSKLKNNSKLNNSVYSKILPNCNNGIPVDKYAGYGVNAWEVLYSIWNTYQTSDGAQFTKNQFLDQAPNLDKTIGPANVFIIRHCEKDSTVFYNLNGNGVYRACQLVEFVNSLAKSGYPISYIVTCNSCGYQNSDSSMRPIQTSSMVSFMLNIPIFIFGGGQDYTAIVSQLYGGTFNGLNVLIVWEHSAIQQLCLNILDTGSQQLISRLPDGITSGDAFFKQKNKCPDGNYKCLLTSNPLNLAYIPTSAPAGVGDNTEYYPYWPTKNFDNIYWFKSNAPDYIFDFFILEQPCLTCYNSCNLAIGLYQPLKNECSGSQNYYNSSDNLESVCQVPSAWIV